MDNLEKLWCHSVTTDEKECGKTISCSYAEDIACFITEKNYMCTYQHFKLHTSAASKRIEGNGKLKIIHYLSYYDNIFAATDFDLYIYGRHTFQIKFYFTMPKAVSELCWNPTETTLAVTYDSDEVALYNFSGCSFEHRYSADLQSDVNNSVYVGWGSHNTQFRSPRAQTQNQAEVERIPMDYEPPKIGWRNQGDQLAVNYFKNGRRFIKVFDKELNALYMTEDYVNLGPTLSFMPMGQYIASAASQGDTNTVVIFERNCRVKCVFEVPENKGIIKKLQYHPNMDMLAVYSIDMNHFGYLNIYLNVNATWCLKNQLYFPPNREIRDFQWVDMPEAAYTICKLVVFTSKNVEYHAFRFIINRCPRKSLVAAINGRILDIYNFSDKIVPHPMGTCTMHFKRPLIQVLFHPTCYLAVVLDSKLQAYLLDVKNNTVLFTTDDMDLLDIASFHDVIWEQGNRMQINIAYNSDDIHQSTKEFSGLVLHVRTFHLVAPHYIIPYNDTSSLVSFKILEDRFSSFMYLTRKLVDIEGVEVTFDFALSSNQEFYVNQKYLCAGITSLFVFRHYLMFTSAQSKFYCVRLLDDTCLFDRDLDLSNLFSRDIEQGSRIVTASDGKLPQIILQAPRGNLETICSRLMAVDIVENFLIANNWKTAIEIMRLSKLNWNVLVDLNPDRFLAHIPDFVAAAECCTVLSTIVNDFGNIDSYYYQYMPINARIILKKHDIVVKILEYLITTNCANNLISIVSIQQRHISLKSALHSIKEVFLMYPVECETDCKKSLQYLFLKEHFQDVISAGYTFYNLDFLTFIYNNSDQDPRVFEPEIATLRNLEPTLLRYQMNMKANNPKGALKYLMRCEQYNAEYIETFIKKYDLEAFAYTTLPSFCRFHTMIATLYAQQLSRYKKHAEAAVILKKVNLMAEALEEYRKAIDWIEVVHIMNILNYEDDTKKQILYQLSEELVKAHRLDEAVTLVEHFIQDPKKAIEILVEHKVFKRAVGLAKMYNLSDVMENLVLPSLRTFIATLNERFDEFRANFEKYTDRLKVVRNNRRISLDNVGPGQYEEDEFYSETESTTSSSSRSTSRTRGSSASSRNRRKEDRKKIDLREGGHYEDIALMRALYLLYTDVFSLGTEVRDIGLIVEDSEYSLAKLLHDKLFALQQDMKAEILDIWPEEFLLTPKVVDNTILAVLQNKADLDPKYWTPPPDELLNAKWTLEMFSYKP